MSYKKCTHPASGFAIVGVAARVGRDLVRIGVTGLANKSFRAEAAEKVFAETKDPAKAAVVVAEGVDANSGIQASANYRKHLARVYTRRALAQAMARTV